MDHGDLALVQIISLDQVVFRRVRRHDDVPGHPRAPAGRKVEHPSLGGRMRFRVPEIAEIVDGDDGFRMKQRHDVGGNEQDIGRPVDHLRRQASVRPQPGSGNRPGLGPERPIPIHIRASACIEIEPPSHGEIQAEQVPRDFAGVVLGACPLGGAQAASIDTNHRVPGRPQRGNQRIAGSDTRANMKSPLQATSPSTVAVPLPDPMLRRI